jgi:protein ImuA
MPSKADTFFRLQAQILSLQGFQPANTTAHSDFGLGPIASSFPDHTFPFSALHEFICESPQEVAASSAFVTGLLSTLLQKGGIVLWISTRHLVFPPALKAFGISPDQIIFINVRKEKEAIWTIEEATKIHGSYKRCR